MGGKLNDTRKAQGKVGIGIPSLLHAATMVTRAHKTSNSNGLGFMTSVGLFLGWWCCSSESLMQAVRMV